jgi:hypothetical protein
VNSTAQAQDPQRHICKDNHSEEYFSFIPPQGWTAINYDDYSVMTRNRVYRHIEDFGKPNSGPLEAVCYQTGKGYADHPLIFIFRAYNMNGTGSELEAEWLSEKYQKRKNKQLALTDQQKILPGRQMQVFHSKYEYRQDIHTAFETIKGLVDGIKFVRITATILGGLNHAMVFCHLTSEDSEKAAGLIDQIVNTFQFESDNVFAGPLE